MDKLRLQLEQERRDLKRAEKGSLDYYKAYFQIEILTSKIEKLEEEGV